MEKNRSNTPWKDSQVVEGGKQLLLFQEFRIDESADFNVQVKSK